MPLAIEKSLRALRPGEPAPAAGMPSVPGELDVLAGWMDHRHTLLLRALLDGVGEKVRLPGSTSLLTQAGATLENLRRDARLKFAEFREKWAARLEIKALLPLLQRNEWFVPHPEGGVTLAGKGARKEARLLYLQTLHDMASDAARQWASIAGRLQALQEGFARDWLKDLPAESAFRAAAVLEATLRDAELQAWKSLRLSLGNLAEEAFIRGAGRWENRRHATPQALVLETAAPWRSLDPSGNGFMGFMRGLSALAERLTRAMLDHYDGKWELFLRGFAESPDSPA